MATKIHRSSGNVFRDVGFPPEEAENLRLRSELMIQVRRILETRKLTQASGAKILGVTQPRISDLVRGRIELFSIDGLVRRPQQPRRTTSAAAGNSRIAETFDGGY